MAFHWLKLLYCKSNTMDEHIVHLPEPRKPSFTTNPSLSCRRSLEALLHAVFLLPKTPHFSPQNPPQNRPKANPSIPNPNPSVKQRPKSHKLLPTLSKLPTEHSSRRIIEIIFRSNWFPSDAPFPGDIDTLFRIRHSPVAIAAFEARRAAVRRLNSGNPRCSADGNEMMRFHVPAADGGFYNGGVRRSDVGNIEGVRTFSGSGAAHDSCGGGSGRRRMLICRVIVGRVGDPEDMGAGADSVRYGEDEILVLDARAVLPCFLVVYVV